MSLANRTVKHFGLHRLDDVELRVIADSEDGILRLEQAELDVVGRLAADPRWRHKSVTIFVLSDLQPLLHQLETLGRRPADARWQQPAELLSRPVVNVYDLASPTSCNVFVNRQAMAAAGYWTDELSLQGLLAHEHAHPLAECAHTAILRQLHLAATLALQTAWADQEAQAKVWGARVQTQINTLLTQLVLTGPREVFTNEIAIAAGFDRALYHLNRQNVRNLVAGLQYRPALQAQLTAVVAQGQLSRAGADLLQFIGDLQAYLPLTMEIAPFRRAGLRAKARDLTKPLVDQVFGALEPEVKPLFDALVVTYTRLRPDAGIAEVKQIVSEGLERAAIALADYQAKLTYCVEEDEKGC